MTDRYYDVAAYPEVLEIIGGRKYGKTFGVLGRHEAPADLTALEGVHPSTLSSESLTGVQVAEVKFWRGSGASLRTQVCSLAAGTVSIVGAALSFRLTAAHTATMLANGGHGAWFWLVSVGKAGDLDDAILRGSANLTGAG